ncbi:MAG: hypothetical protein A2046_08080 [Bacteroidetes bacterium GWA2_30_7]|nr:MAG: hypothetical protein A2046_08080 [Bacteroidetes bacterium GWA2_30_7]
MGLPGFFKLPKHKSFNYSPRYYDERKEELEKLKNESAESRINFSDKPIIMKGFFKENLKNNQKKALNKSNARLIIIILFLFFILYYFFYK